MKKCFAILVVFICFTACKKEESNGGKPSGVGTSNSTTNLQADELPCNLESIPDCEDADDFIVVLDKAKIDADFPNWCDDNASYLCNKKILNLKCNTNYIVNLNSISTTDETKVSLWLQKYSKYICYDDSYPFIRKSHILTDYKLIEKVENEIKAINSTASSYSLDVFISKIKDFDTIKYNTYVSFYMDTTTNKLTFKEESKYTKGMLSYSVPLFNSIVDSYSIDPLDYKNYKLTFVKIKDATGLNDIIAFKLERGKFIEFYDYSSNPGKSSPGTIFLNLY